ncbi:MAG: DUF4321 domain-containing protein [Anaeromicrobium sp.]|jgi:hypothetical protein|uniref:DUF4321 domain-containing protein n=1 Tax=Anaeromicrobium sp. TaxID=1929132 RepID=UPI0025E3EC55|nr:DUF4321 domain-containing protein [Anaeromicrobium sp.]MCT4594942.1 DUF4321 domain-containing protein [Anaeromicrobium sp.]
MNSKSKGVSMLILLMIVGIVVGGVIGDLFKDTFEILKHGKHIGFKPCTTDLLAIKFTLGLELYMNLASVLGGIIGMVIFFRL